MNAPEIKLTLTEVFMVLASRQPQPCQHERTGARWGEGIKEVKCIDCGKRIWAVRTDNDLRDNPAYGC